MTNEEKMNQYMQRNVKIFPPYLALTWDVIFVWTISTMFFTTQKGLSFSQTILLDSMLMVFGCLLCVPLTNLFKKVDSVRATQIGTLGYAVYLLLCIFGNNFVIFIIAQIFLAFGYVVCGIKGNSILTKSLNLLKRDKDYNRVYGKGISFLYIIEALGAIFITYIYNWKPHFAYWISFVIVIFAFCYGFLFISPEKFQKQNIIVQAKNEPLSKETAKKKKENVYIRILKSPFFLCLLFFMFMMRGTTSIISSNFKMFLQQIITEGWLSASLFGYIYAVGKLFTALSSRFQFKFNLRFGVRSLIIFATSLILLFFVCGMVYTLIPLNWVTIVLIIILSYAQMCIIQPCRIFVNNYMQVCISPNDVEQAYSVRTMVEYCGYAGISAMYSYLLTIFSDNYGIVSIVYMAILCVPIIVSTVLFIRQLIKKHAQKYTIIKPEYTEND